jgi:glycosyltransferase involved in cell wall biosynthesis
VLRAARDADVLVNVSGMLADERVLEQVPVRVYLDLDPAFNQLWHAVDGIDMRFGAHTHFVTVGQSIGSPDCPVPTCGLEWLPTLQPVVLERWPYANGVVHDAATTVGNWRGYGSVEHDGVFYGQKAHSLRQLLDLPARTREQLLLALAIHPAETPDLEALAAARWELLDPADVAATPEDYQAFVQGSKAELGIAKSGYVLSRCGWFSDRSACYLASGRPVVAQDTGFPRHLPTGEGLLAFSTVDEAAAALDEVGADYERHRRAARALAEEHFDSDRVLTSLLERL